MKNIFVLVSIILFNVSIMIAQSASELETYADSILAPFSDPIRPGVSGAIVKDGKVIYIKANGLADPYNSKVANLQTKYPVQDVSKQFTTLAFLHLLEDGVIKLDESILKYLPDLPAHNRGITISHVLNHTTGLNDYYIINMISSGDDAAITTNQDALDIVAAQEELATTPGSKFSVFNSDTESLLMAEIVASASGMSLPEYAMKKIFKPLGLNNTVFVDDVSQVIENTALSFELVDGNPTSRTLTQNIVGPAGIFISIEDIAKWYSFFSPQNSEPIYDLVKKLDSKVRNNNGDDYVSGWGEMTYGRSYLHAERGIPKYWQFGLVGAYGANLFRFPGEDVTAIAIGNNNQYNGYSAMMMLTPLLEDKYTAPASIDENLIETVSLSTEQLNKWEGTYFGTSHGGTRSFKVVNDTLLYLRGEQETKLVPLQDNKFQALVGSDDVIMFTFGLDGADRYYNVSSGGSDPDRYEAYTEIAYSEKQLAEYKGTYINKSLGQIYTIDIENKILKAHHHKNGAIEISPLIKDVFNSDYYPLGAINFARKNDRIVSFSLKNLGLNKVTFSKVQDCNYL